ncbi:heterokaryon incompatibility protein [Ceratobasidium sp. AG-Ba]|nr:heterokaryon incompatibility protein [Ceratobasidium sp. AG-Ba]
MGDANQDSDGFKVIYSVNPFHLYETGARFDLAPVASLKRYRFIECDTLLETQTLQVREYSRIPQVYVTVSHVWDGVDALPDDKTFHVQGANPKESSGRIPISIWVIQEACRASRKLGSNLLWIDRLCVIQANESDKSWQFKKMYDLYKGSATCLVIPNGLAQLTSLNQESPWMNRGWTLQEAVAPKDTQVMFLWEGDECYVKAYPRVQRPNYITLITEGRSAMAPLGHVLHCCISGNFIITDRTGAPNIRQLGDIQIFGAGSTGPGNPSPSITMLAAAISESLEEDEDRVYHCLWKCMLMRVTRDRCDMIFSIMGSFGVTLNAEDYPDKGDVIRPAIALAQELLRRGKSATWLGALCFGPPCPQLSTFPAFPRFTEKGTKQALVRDRHGFVKASSLMLSEYIDNATKPPGGEMDADGYFTFLRRSTPVALAPVRTKEEWKNVDAGRYLWGLGDEVWESSTHESNGTINPRKRFGVLLGYFHRYTLSSQPEDTSSSGGDTLRALIVEEHAPGKFHVVSYAMLTPGAMNWLQTWEKRYFSVGGPDPLNTQYPDEPVIEVDPIPKVPALPTDYFAKVIEGQGVTRPQRLNSVLSEPEEVPNEAEEVGMAPTMEYDAIEASQSAIAVGEPLDAEVKWEVPVEETAEGVLEKIGQLEVKETLQLSEEPRTEDTGAPSGDGVPYTSLHEPTFPVFPQSYPSEIPAFSGPLASASAGSTFAEKIGRVFGAEDTWTSEVLRNLKREVEDLFAE